jgi:hypothetical protein
MGSYLQLPTRRETATDVSHMTRASATRTGIVNKCRNPGIDELRLEWLSSPQAYSARPRVVSW